MYNKLYGSLAFAAAMLVASQSAQAVDIAVAQKEVAVGVQFNAAGIKYQMMQFEVPAFGSDKVYIVKFPVPADLTNPQQYIQANVFVYGGPVPDAMGYSDNTINKSSGGLNGFPAYFNESQTYNGNYGRYGNTSTLSNFFSMENGVAVQLDSSTTVQINLFRKNFESTPMTSATHLPDTTSKLKVKPLVIAKADRDKYFANSRVLYKYVSIKEKI